jgi:hypothetical protein
MTKRNLNYGGEQIREDVIGILNGLDDSLFVDISLNKEYEEKFYKTIMPVIIEQIIELVSINLKELSIDIKEELIGNLKKLNIVDLDEYDGENYLIVFSGKNIDTLLRFGESDNSLNLTTTITNDNGDPIKVENVYYSDDSPYIYYNVNEGESL